MKSRPNKPEIVVEHRLGILYPGTKVPHYVNTTEDRWGHDALIWLRYGDDRIVWHETRAIALSAWMTGPGPKAKPRMAPTVAVV